LARKILLADDSVTAQNMGRRILSDAGYEVTTVNNGSAALKRIAESKPDLIVLDVYMPGYGGLEVCQRLRESRETARIPILLTVGKLEPFKPEEARRVRADAFIVKPFEASELLTALTKLEDRIVPQPAPYKPGRFAKAMSAIDTDVPSNEYGDLESGWKNRLKIPVPQSHGPDVEEEQPVERAESRKADVPPLVPRDITPEEIAAINAAAAAFGSQVAEPESGQEANTAPPVPVSESAVKADEPKPEAIPDADDEQAATFASAAPVVETLTEPESVEAVQKSEPTVAEEVRTEAAEIATSAIPETQPELSALVEEVASAAPVETPAQAEERDDFAAALESLSPANGHGVAPPFNVPRWTAELVALTDAESALILEQEMQNAVAAMAAVNASESAASTSMQDVRQEAVASSPSHEETREASTSLVAAMMNETLPTLSDLVDSVLPHASAEAVAPESQGAAFAAAAAVGGDAVSQSAVPSEVQPAAPSPSSEEDRQRESELAAAWESWKHIRESVVEPQLKSQVADAAAEPQALRAEQVPSAVAEPDGETGSNEDSVASIVDSVLADLKPKLMEEISRKMGKEKKRR
jgi:CheY-like chemotaxis protein